MYYIVSTFLNLELLHKKCVEQNALSLYIHIKKSAIFVSLQPSYV